MSSEYFAVMTRHIGIGHSGRQRVDFEVNLYPADSPRTLPEIEADQNTRKLSEIDRLFGHLP